MANNIQYGYGNQGQIPSYGYQQPYNGPYNMQQTSSQGQSCTQQYGQSYSQQAPSNRAWADDEYEARSIRVPDGWPADTPFVIWNPRQPIQYVKAVDARGRNQYNGRYMSRDIGDRMSGHYPTHMIAYYPQNEYQDY